MNDEPSNIKEGYLVGLTDETLANMFAVSDDLCGSKFELKVNDVRFVGNPVSLEPSKDETGQWTSTITMFHIVFALKATAAYSIVQCYHELSQRIGLILAHEEKRMGYVRKIILQTFAYLLLNCKLIKAFDYHIYKRLMCF